MVLVRRFAVPALGALALATAAFNGALASRPAAFHGDAQPSRKVTNVNGNLRVHNVARVDKNLSVYGRVYAHGGEQVWSGLLVRSGGVKTDSLDVTGPVAAQSATIANNLQAGTVQATAINGATLSLTGAGTVAGGLSVAGKVTSNGLDAGAGGVATSGTISGGQITSNGQLTAGSIATNGTLTGGAASFNSLAVSGNVNFSGATVSGLTLSNLTGGNLASLSLGSQSSGATPLTLSANGKTTTIGVDASGNLTLGSALASGNLGVTSNATVGGGLAVNGAATVGGTLTVGGANGITATSITAPPSGSNVSAPGTLTLNGSLINLSGAASVSGGLTLANGSDLVASSTTGTTTNATHVRAAGDRDLAGIATLNVGGGAAAGTDIQTSVSFINAFSSVPAVTITPLDDPNPGQQTAAKEWVTLTQASNGTYTGFTIHHVSSTAAPGPGYSVRYAYHVIGS